MMMGLNTRIEREGDAHWYENIKIVRLLKCYVVYWSGLNQNNQATNKIPQLLLHRILTNKLLLQSKFEYLRPKYLPTYMNLNIYVLNTYDYVPDMTNCMYRLYLRKTGRHEVDYLHQY